MKLKAFSTLAFLLTFLCVGANAQQSDYYVVHGADENVTHGTHYPKTVGIVGIQSPQQQLDNIASAPGCAAYFDKTSTVFEVKSGETVTPLIDINGSWMHGYVYVDWNNNKQFDVNLEGNGPYIKGEGNDSITLNLTVSDVAKFATLRLNIIPRNEGAEYIVQLLDSSNKLQREFTHLSGGEHTINYVPTGEMRVRIIEDANRNGSWDSGNLVERRQSERAELYKNEQDEELFTMKAGWEFEFTLDMGSLFAPVTMDQLIERLNYREQVRLRKEAEEKLKNAGEHSDHNHSHSTTGSNSISGMTGGTQRGF